MKYNWVEKPSLGKNLQYLIDFTEGQNYGLLSQVKKQQLKLDMEQQTGFKLGNEYVKAVYCHPAYLTYMQSTS